MAASTRNRETPMFASSPHIPQPLRSEQSGPLKGRVRPPGRQVDFASRLHFRRCSAAARPRSTGLLEGDDVLRTAQGVPGAGRPRRAPRRGPLARRGVGRRRACSRRATRSISATPAPAARLMMGVVGGHPITATFDGDASLRKRPMRRILDPLQLMGAQVLAEAEGGRCPITLMGARDPAPIVYRTAGRLGADQVGGAAGGPERARRDDRRDRERGFARSHRKDARPFRRRRQRRAEGAGPAHHPRWAARTRPRPVGVPADPSSAAFPIVAALITPGSDIVVEGVMMNPLRAGLLTTLIEMGARHRNARPARRRRRGGGGSARARERAHGVDVPAARAPSMIDEYPVLAVAAAFARGATRMRGLHELRVKESDRLAAVAAGLRARRASTTRSSATISIVEAAAGRAAAAWSQPISTIASP